MYELLAKKTPAEKMQMVCDMNQTVRALKTLEASAFESKHMDSAREAEQSGDWKGAEKEYHSILERSSDDASAALGLGRLYKHELKKHVISSEEYKKLIKSLCDECQESEDSDD